MDCYIKWTAEHILLILFKYRQISAFCSIEPIYLLYMKKLKEGLRGINIGDMGQQES